MPVRSADLVSRLRAAGCVFAEDEAVLLAGASDDPAVVEALTRRRVAGEPLEQLLGWVQFAGHRVVVRPEVFVPRRRTEQLVESAAARMAGRTGPVVVDLCCGSGAVGLALAARIAPHELHAADAEPAAVACARLNLEPVGGSVYQGDLFDALPAGLRGRVDLLVANVPYVPTRSLATLPPEARDHEPRRALDGGADGLDVVRRLVRSAGEWLAPDGWLLVETSAEQANAAAAAFSAAGLEAGIDVEDDTCVVAGCRRMEPVPAGQATVLARYLQLAREAVLWKLEGLSEYDIRRPLTPTGTNLLGLVKHLASVEAGYLGATFGRPYPEPLPWHADDADPNADMWATPEESREELIAFYRRVWAHGDETVAAGDLDTRGAVPWWPPERAEVTLQQVLVHLVAETNRHAGHADIVRELIDTRAGLRPGATNLPDDYDWAAHRERVEQAALAPRTVDP